MSGSIHWDCHGRHTNTERVPEKLNNDYHDSNDSKQRGKTTACTAMTGGSSGQVSFFFRARLLPAAGRGQTVHQAVLERAVLQSEHSAIETRLGVAGANFVRVLPFPISVARSKASPA